MPRLTPVSKNEHDFMRSRGVFESATRAFTFSATFENNLAFKVKQFSFLSMMPRLETLGVSAVVQSVTNKNGHRSRRNFSL